MQNITVRLDPAFVEQLEEEAEEHDTTRTEYIRDILQFRRESSVSREEYEELQKEYAELQEEYDAMREEYEKRIAELETELGRVNKEKRQVLELREEHTDLVKAVQSDQTIQERKAKAGILTRWKWSLAGMPDE